MNRDKLARAIRAKAAVDGDADTKELLRSLARIVEGGPVARSFGTPGDWGYETPIGQALAARPDLPASPPDFICKGGVK